MLEITSLRDGSVVNYHDGVETDEYLEITVSGVSSPQADVSVNGVPARNFDRNFSAKIRLKDKVNRIVAVAEDAYGEYTQTITVIWDKKSFKRYNFFIDDCCFFLRNIHLNNFSSIFEDHFLARLKNIHDKYGTLFTLNLFLHDDHHDYSICDFPDNYKSEFQANSDWLKMSFHARSEFPDRPYQSADAKTLAVDFDAVYHEVCRFAGKECFIAPMVIHWAMTNPENFPVLTARGTKCLAACYLDTISHIGESHTVKVTDIGFHYEQDVAQYITQAHLWYDRRYDLFLLDDLLICNFTDIDQIHAAIEKLKQNPRDTVNVITHEQYSYPDYFNYIPNHLDRVEEVCRLLNEYEYQPSWFSHGILGNCAWDV